MQDNIKTALDEYIQELNDRHGSTYHFEVDPKGKTFMRIIRRDRSLVDGSVDTKHGSVYGFMEVATGDLYKAAGWKAPAKNFARGNVFDKRVYDRLSIS